MIACPLDVVSLPCKQGASIIDRGVIKMRPLDIKKVLKCLARTHTVFSPVGAPRQGVRRQPKIDASAQRTYLSARHGKCHIVWTVGFAARQPRGSAVVLPVTANRVNHVTFR